MIPAYGMAAIIWYEYQVKKGDDGLYEYLMGQDIEEIKSWVAEANRAKYRFYGVINYDQ